MAKPATTSSAAEPTSSAKTRRPGVSPYQSKFGRACEFGGRVELPLLDTARHKSTASVASSCGQDLCAARDLPVPVFLDERGSGNAVTIPPSSSPLVT